ncbi:hypothetical protein G6F60_014604 [Rhizopus arrhizus]|nr:hypothetical protein G6F60_014604 [Rhizopus arrhizus]
MRGAAFAQYRARRTDRGHQPCAAAVGVVDRRPRQRPTVDRGAVGHAAGAGRRPSHRQRGDRPGRGPPGAGRDGQAHRPPADPDCRRLPRGRQGPPRQPAAQRSDRDGQQRGQAAACLP